MQAVIFMAGYITTNKPYGIVVIQNGANVVLDAQQDILYHAI